MFPTAILAGVVGWLALRATPPHWIGVACAYAILLSPIVLGTVWWSGDGFQLAIAVSACFTSGARSDRKLALSECRAAHLVYTHDIYQGGAPP